MKNGKLQCKDISTEDILEYLANRQGKWTSLWYGYFRENDPEGRNTLTGEVVDDVYYAMPEGTNHKLAHAKMRKLYEKDFVGGCPCGCRGDFEITDKGLEFIGRDRVKGYTGY